MKSSFANRLPYLDEQDQVPRDSAVRTLLRGADCAPCGKGVNATEYLNISQSLRELGYLRTSLTYHALGIKDDATYCLLLEQDGFARETHAILSHAKSNKRYPMGELIVAHNPEQRVWYSLEVGHEGTRDLKIRSANQEAVIYREQLSHKSSGILQAVDRWFDMSFSELCDRGLRNGSKAFLPLVEQPRTGQLDLFAGPQGC